MDEAGERNGVIGRRERKKLEVGQRIRLAAAELFSARGYEQTTVEEIAELADVSKGTFFNYFARKDALLVALAEETLETLWTELGPEESWRGTAAQQARRLFLRLAAHAEQDPALSKTIVVENMRTYWLRASEPGIEHEIRALVERVLRAGQERGEFAHGFDVSIAARLLEAAYALTLVEWLREGSGQRPLQEQLGEKLDIIFRGLGAAAESGEGVE